MFSRILIANRGEIALRIIRAAREMGIETVAVYSQADKEMSFVKAADQSVCIGPANPTLSYLNIPAIISAAEVCDVDAIHPGYGFLAENAHFADVCADSGIAFIGPKGDSMRLLGDKVAARELMMKANVPVVPGSDGEIKDVKEAVKIANKIGYPVIVKASAGGGGRGMRVAHNDISLQTAFGAAKSEAEANFNDGTMYMEKYIVEPRHVEVQVMADKFGNVVHFYERDCSVQRRHQKLIEESPCPVLDEKTRQILCNSAIKAIKASKYENAATVEFILDKDKNYYFIEANTRIQVEHPVTEMVTGYDLIKYQIKVAAGEKLDITQDDIKHNGVAIECRINAEDPARDFAPCPGPINEFFTPGGFGVRVDTHVHQGSYISPHYDSMIAKLIVHQPTREEAIATMTRALNEFTIGPIKTTIPAHLDILSHNMFVTNQINTGFIEEHM